MSPQEMLLSHTNSSAKKNAPPDKAIFECITMLAAAVGPNLTKLLHDQLDLIFANEFNEYVCNALAAIAKSIQPLLRSIQDRLLEKLSMILSGQPYKPLGAPLPAIRTEVSMAQVTPGPVGFPSQLLVPADLPAEPVPE
jgi:hypothetical protein